MDDEGVRVRELVLFGTTVRAEERLVSSVIGDWGLSIVIEKDGRRRCFDSLLLLLAFSFPFELFPFASGSSFGVF